MLEENVFASNDTRVEVGLVNCGLTFTLTDDCVCVLLPKVWYFWATLYGGKDREDVAYEWAVGLYWSTYQGQYGWG